MFVLTSLRSVLGRVRSLSTAKEGLRHWWVQRLTALALIPLTVWFVVSLISLVGVGHNAFVLWLANPINATAMILFLAIAFHHTQLGVQVVLEDYVTSLPIRTASIILVKLLCFGLSALGILSVLIVTFGV